MMGRRGVGHEFLALERRLKTCQTELAKALDDLAAYEVALESWQEVGSRHGARVAKLEKALEWVETEAMDPVAREMAAEALGGPWVPDTTPREE